MGTEFEVVASLAALPVGRMCAVPFGGREVVVCRTAAGVFALDNICTHAEARMSEGVLRGTRLTCPFHGASFDVTDGRVLGGPATVALRTYLTRVVGERIEVAR